MRDVPPLIDTHCHIHEADYPLPISEVTERAQAAGVVAMLCVGTSQASSDQAVRFAAMRQDSYAVVGVHPHEASEGWGSIDELAKQPRVVGIGEIGLDYYYTHSPRPTQLAALEAQLQLARDHDLPVSFHVREAFDDFWPVLDNFAGIRGVLHSFTDSQDNAEQALTRGLMIGINGISTFTKDARQITMFMAIPLDRLLLETDAPFLTPVPFRGKVNEPGLVKEVARHYAATRGVTYDELAHQTTANARQLFGLSD